MTLIGAVTSSVYLMAGDGKLNVDSKNSSFVVISLFSVMYMLIYDSR